MIVVVNMLDIAKAHHLEINLDALREKLGCPVVGLVAARGTGVDELRAAVSDFFEAPRGASECP